jgi:hypothetical protein
MLVETLIPSSIIMRPRGKKRRKNEEEGRSSRRR